MNLYRVLLFVKFAGVLAYASGLGAALLSVSLRERKRAVHAIASPGIVVVWAAGYGLSTQLAIPLTECWIISGLLLSLVSLMGLIYGVSRAGHSAVAAGVSIVALLAVLIVMVFRPTWSHVLGAQ